MEVTEVRIKLMEGSEDRLRAFCSITLDHCFVVRDLKVIDGASGPFVAMPSRKLSAHCHRCHYKNHLRASYCNHCGAKLKVTINSDSPQKLYADVAHPVNSECREMISGAVLAEFEHELARATQPGYRSRYDDDFDSLSESDDGLYSAAASQAGPEGGDSGPEGGDSGPEGGDSGPEGGPAGQQSGEQIRRVDRGRQSASPPHPPRPPGGRVEQTSRSRPPDSFGALQRRSLPNQHDSGDSDSFGAGIFD